MKRIAITGGVGEGKSTVLQYVASLGISTVSSDEVARQVFVGEAVQRRLGELLHLQLPVRPQQVRDLFPKVPHLRRSLNQIMHPLIRAELRRSQAQVAEVPLLVEACILGDYDCIWVVTCGREEQLRRVSERLGSESAAARLIATQLPTRVKIAFADRVVRTNCAETAVKDFVAKAIRLDLAG